MRLSPSQIADLNAIAAFLAQDDLGALDGAALARATGSPTADALVLLGNSVLHTAERAFEAFAAGAARWLVIAGGIGHSTAILRDALAAHPRYRDALGPDLPEAELLARVAVGHFGLDPARLVLETESTNCGDNAVETRAALARRAVAGGAVRLAGDGRGAAAPRRPGRLRAARARVHRARGHPSGGGGGARAAGGDGGGEALGPARGGAWRHDLRPRRNSAHPAPVEG